MHNAQILTHPAFERSPVLNAVRRGPTPRGIPMLNRERWERRSELGLLRRWAKAHGIEPDGFYGHTPCYNYNKLRELKAQQEAQRTPSPEERIAEYEEAIAEVCRGLLIAAGAIRKLDDKLRGDLSRD